MGARIPDPAHLARQWLILIQGAVAWRMVAGDDAAALSARETAEILLLRP